ncbi:MAG: hypothetical protein P8188_17500 [Gemmatimonadota bacterium]
MTSAPRNRLFTALMVPVLAAGIVLVVALVPRASELEARSASADDPAWLQALDAPHRMLFDAAQPAGGVPLVHALNYYESWKQAEGIGDDDIDAVIALYGGTTFHGLDDAMWAKYGLGEMMGQNDLQGAPYTRNPWRVNPTFDGGTVAPAGMEPLAARGATFLMCNNALTYFAGKVAAAHGLEAADVYSEMKAHILPQVTLVPAMVVAIDQAQVAGISYHRQ